jgi:hypothetical protein
MDGAQHYKQLRHACTLYFVPMFAAVLTFNSRRVDGMKFQDFMPLEEDRRRFEERLRGGLHEIPGAAAGCLYATLRSMGTNIHVEFFYVRFLDLVGCQHFCLGIKESAEERAPVALTLPEPPRPLRRRARRSRAAAPAADMAAAASGGSTRRPSSRLSARRAC